MDALKETGYDGPVIVEQEDSVLGRTEDDAAAGLTTARDHLAPLLA